MKKSLVMVIALLVLVSAIATGTFAQYSATKSASVSLTGYAFDVSVTGKSTGDTAIAPGQTKSGTFTVTNSGTGAIKVSEISVTSSDADLSVVTTPTASGSTIAAAGSEDYTFEVKLGDTVNKDATYTVTISVTVVDDLGNSDVITLTDVTFA